MLQSRPDLAAQVRARIASSGLTADQVRERLRANGYPENLLDGYLPGAAPTAGGQPSAFTVDAISAIGLTVGEPADTAVTTAARKASAGASGVFGLDLFRTPTTRFDPLTNGPVDRTYKLGPGDELALILTGDVEITRALPVSREGFILIQQVGQIYVNNLTLDQLEEVLYARLPRVYSGVGKGPSATTRFALTVTRLRTNQVYVLGEVETPGSYRISSAGTAFSALYAAGGPNNTGSLRAIEVRRNNKVVALLDVYDYLLRGDASRDPRLESGDVLFVPVSGRRVSVLGEVGRPSIFELTSAETLKDLLRMAGGFTYTASRERVQIRRILPPGERTEPGKDRVVMDVSSPEFVHDSAPAMALRGGDEIYVWPISRRVHNRVKVTGAVRMDGDIEFKSGMKLSEAIRAAGGLTEPGDLILRTPSIQVTRTFEDRTQVVLHSSFADTLGALTDDLALRQDDEIRVFNRSEFNVGRFVGVAGAVQKPGRFPWRDGMTLRDLIMQAGGLAQGALLSTVEIARLPAERADRITAQTIHVPIDSSYLFERRQDGTYFGPPGLPSAAKGTNEVGIEAYDQVTVLLQPGFQLQRTVTVFGEVRFPSTYALLKVDERLSDLIKRAGGPTERAFVGGATLRRIAPVGRVRIDFEAALRRPGSRDDLVLEAGDEIVFPTLNPVVRVTGSVYSPTSVAYVPGKAAEYYVNLAGGATSSADLKHLYVQQPNGSVEARERAFLWMFSEIVPGPGSVVNVPEKSLVEGRDWIPGVIQILQVLSSMTAIVILSSRK